MKKAVLYLCDPEKNTGCVKTNCAYRRDDARCFSTRNPEFARLSENGTPIIAGVWDIETCAALAAETRKEA